MEPSSRPSSLARLVPNALSGLRLLLSPAWVGAAESHRASTAGDGFALWPVVLVMAMGVSDLLDGFLARRYGTASRLGEVLDAAADKLAVLTVLTYLTFRGAPGFTAVPVWLFVAVLVHDACMAVGVAVVKRRRGQVDSRHEMHGKIAAVLLFVLLLVAVAGLGASLVLGLSVAVVLGLTVSTVSYARRGWAQLGR